MKKYFTVDDVMSFRPCYKLEAVEKLFCGKKKISLFEILNLDIPSADKIWIVTKLLPKKRARLFACDCAETVLYLFEKDCPNDKRPRNAIEISKKFANGKVSAATMTSARDAASAAAYAASNAASNAAYAASNAAYAASNAAYSNRDAAAYAARNAAYAARNAAAYAARNAAYAAAVDATAKNAYAAAGDAQIEMLKEYCK